MGSVEQRRGFRFAPAALRRQRRSQLSRLRGLLVGDERGAAYRNALHPIWPAQVHSEFKPQTPEPSAYRRVLPPAFQTQPPAKPRRVRSANGTHAPKKKYGRTRTAGAEAILAWIASNKNALLRQPLISTRDTVRLLPPSLVLSISVACATVGLGLVAMGCRRMGTHVDGGRKVKLLAAPRHAERLAAMSPRQRTALWAQQPRLSLTGASAGPGHLGSSRPRRASPGRTGAVHSRSQAKARGPGSRSGPLR